MAKLVGIEQDYPGHEHKTQVFRATHSSAEAYNKKGQYIGLDWSRKSFMERSFISFSYGGKYIEDFNLIAVFSNDGLNKTMTATFKDLTSDYDVVDGQFFWGTKYEANKLDFSLATDGITENELDEFLHWFHGGVERELILSEHPNRAILARVADAPEIQMIPFEEPTTVKIEGFEYETSTTLYKGTISLSFTMDEPYWYSKVNLLGRAANSTELTEAGLEDGVWMDVWQSANAQEVDVYSDKDALKIIKEDLVPTAGMLSNDFLLGDAITVNTDFTIESNKKNTSDNILDTDIQTLDNPIKYNGVAVAGIVEETDSGYGDLIGFVGPRIYSQENKGARLGPSDTLYLYYPGTAPEHPEISFDFTPIITGNYIASPRNSITNSARKYDILNFISQSNHELKFSLPSALQGYNQAIKVFNNWQTGNNNMAELRTLIRDSVNHRDARAWAILVVDSLGETWNLQDALARMKYFLTNPHEDTELSTSVDINCQTGRTTGIVGHRIIGYGRNLVRSSAVEKVFTNNANYDKTSSSSGLYYLTIPGYTFSTYGLNTLTANDKITISFDYEYSGIKKPHAREEIDDAWVDYSTIISVSGTTVSLAQIGAGHGHYTSSVVYRSKPTSPWILNRINRTPKFTLFARNGYFGTGAIATTPIGFDIVFEEGSDIASGSGHFVGVTNLTEAQAAERTKNMGIYGRISYTGNIANGIYNSESGSTGTASFKISNLKIELGTQETIWCTAPEDAEQSGYELPTTNNDFATYGTINMQEEDVGDMIKSNYISFDERNYPDANGYIQKWTSSAPQNSYKVITDNENGLSNLYVKYRYKYY